MAAVKEGQSLATAMLSLSGLVTIVTGGSDGIGYETWLQLAGHGARVYILSRSAQRAEDVITTMRQSSSKAELDLIFLQADLDSLHSVKEATEKFESKESKMHILVNNAGIMATPYALTSDGFETQWQINYVSHFLLIKAILPILSSTAAEDPSSNCLRIVNLSSDAVFVSLAPNSNFENPKLEGMMAACKHYSHSKLALVLLTHHLHTILSHQNLAIRTYVLHLGVVEANLQAADPTLLGTSIKFAVRWGLIPGKLGREEGGRTTLACATSDDKEIVDGSSAFLGPLGRRDNRGDALVAKWEGQGMGKKLWEASEGVLQEKGFDA